MTSNSDKKRPADVPGIGSASGGKKRKDPSSDSDDSVFDAIPETIVFAFAARNAKNHFFIPSRSNFIAGIPYENVMIDNGCSSILLPFPADGNSLQQFANSRFDWSIFDSIKGTGAHNSLVLKIKSRICQQFPMKLNGKLLPIQLPFLRFNLGKTAATFLRDNKNIQEQLRDDGKTKIEVYLKCVGKINAPERRHVLLGQSFLGQVFSEQLGDIIVVMDANNWTTIAHDLPNIFARLHGDTKNLLESYAEFDDLEDQNHGGDADGDGDIRRYWDPDEECIDELFT